MTCPRCKTTFNHLRCFCGQLITTHDAHANHPVVAHFCTLKESVIGTR